MIECWRAIQTQHKQHAKALFVLRKNTYIELFFPSVHLATALCHHYFVCFSNSPGFETRHRFIEGRIKTFNQFNRALTAAHFFKVTRPRPYAEGGRGGGGTEGLLKFMTG